MNYCANIFDPPGNFYREFGPFYVKNMTRWRGEEGGKRVSRIWISYKKNLILSE